MCENTCATTQPAAQSFPPNSTSMDALVVGLAPKKGASKKKQNKKSFIHSAEARPRLDGKAGRLSVSHFTHREDRPMRLVQ